MAHKQIKYSDQELFLLIKNCQRNNFNYIYDSYSPLLYGLLVGAGLSKSYSCEILEQTFVNIWKNDTPICVSERLSKIGL